MVHTLHGGYLADSMAVFLDYSTALMSLEPSEGEGDHLGHTIQSVLS